MKSTRGESQCGKERVNKTGPRTGKSLFISLRFRFRFSTILRLGNTCSWYKIQSEKRAHSKSPATLEPTLLVPDSEASTVVSFFPSSFSQRGTSDLGIAWKPPKWWGGALGGKGGGRGVRGGGGGGDGQDSSPAGWCLAEIRSHSVDRTPVLAASQPLDPQEIAGSLAGGGPVPFSF